jgi:hypothetical protein
MDFNDFPECCGAFILYDFPRSLYRMPPDDKASGIRDVKRWIGGRIKSDTGVGAFHLLILAGQQLKDLAPLVKELGFERVFSKINKNTGKECVLYARETDEGDVEEVGEEW